MAEETILLDVQIDQSDAQKQLVQTEKNLLNLKKQQAELTKEYKAGKISQDDYVEANLRLQKSISKENDQKRTLTKLIDTESNSRNALKNQVSTLTKEYDNLNRSTEAGAKRAQQLEKELKDLNAEITKSSKSAGLFKDQIGNYPDQFSKIGGGIAKATDEIQPFGQSVSGASSALAKFASPAGIAIGLLTGMATMYANSATGARDLEFAQNQLGAATSILSERFAQLVTSADTAEGEGFFSTLTTGALAYLDVSLAVEARIKAQAEATIKNLEISRAFAAGFAKDSERLAEQARRIRDDENQALDVRLQKTKEIDAVLTQSQARTVTVIQAQINAIKQATVNYGKNLEAQLKVAQLEGEIKDKQEEITGKLTENVTARRAIIKLIQEQQALEAGVAAADKRLEVFRFQERDVFAGADTREQVQADIDKRALERMKQSQAEQEKERKAFLARDVEATKRAASLKEQVAFAELATAATIAGAMAQLFGQESVEYKAFASAQTIISTYAAATKAYEAAFNPPTIASPALGAAYAAAAIAQGLANLAAINGVQFAEGGYTGAGSKWQPAGTVHKGEVVWSQKDVAAVGGPAVANAMRPTMKGYADGGFVTEQMISPYQQAMITANAIRNMPAPVVGVREFNRVANRVEVREKISQR